MFAPARKTKRREHRFLCRAFETFALDRDVSSAPVPQENPNIANIMGMPFLEDAGVESITERGNGKGSNVRTFRNVLGLDKFGMGKTKKSKLNLSPNKEPALPPATRAPALTIG